VKARERLCPKPRARAFFLSATGSTLDRSQVSKTLRKITTTLGLRTATIHPRAHDLRHSFAVATLIGWQRSGLRIDERIADLSTYLGHVSPADTYWYLTATPELMEGAARRLELRFGALS
jgi:integrase